ncbi:MAG: S9 family peptidase [Parvularculaceae bacterium]|nr:S9 family peptidase [Parvularculaceae bacterium]
MQKSIVALASALFISFAGGFSASAAPPIEVYGNLPGVWGLDISPSGSRYAYFSHKDGKEYFVIAEDGKGVIGGGGTGDIKPRSIFFATENYAIVIASETASTNFFKGKWENSSAFSFNIEKEKFVTLLKGFDQLYPGQSGLGRVIGRLAGEDKVFMPAYIGEYGRTPTYGLLKSRLDIASAVIESKGAQDTVDWFVDEHGVILAREDFDDDSKAYRIWTGKNGGLKRIYESKAKPDGRLDMSVYGVMPDESGLVVFTSTEEDEFASVSKMDFSGAVSGPIFSQTGFSIESVLRDGNRRVIGVEYAGMRPLYEFFDTGLTNDMYELANLFPDDAVHLVGWTEDLGKVLIKVAGGATSPGFYRFDRNQRQLARLASIYPEISDADVNPVMTIEYKARDGRKIPALITLPVGKSLGSEPLPLIVIPHGGPEAYDAMGFDWMAQYFASRGYMVLQPNFRGSYGFGREHREAGYGEWGGKMQDDVTDGVELLTRKNWADANRTCIIGASYGGYAALAGGAFTPDLYKCVAAIAPVSDLSEFMKWKRDDAGSNSSILAYWTRLIGDRKDDAAKLAAISPVNAAANFTAPVLLLHGDDDIVVPRLHSQRMESALKAAGKDVRYIKLKGEDHWLSGSETRLQTLRELDRFVKETIGGN